MTEFRFEADIDVRFRDLDAEGHVNNAVYGTYLEHARMQYVRDVIEARMTKGEATVAHVSIDYHRSITLGEDVTVAVRTSDVGNSSVEMAYEVRADGAVAATGESVLVTLDPGTGRPRRVPDEWREPIAEFEDGIEHPGA